jgi:hypothetical protein
MALLVHDGVSAWIDALATLATPETGVARNCVVEMLVPHPSSVSSSPAVAATTSLIAPQYYANALSLLATMAFAARRASYG